MITQLMNQDLGALNLLSMYKLKKAFQFILSLSVFSLFILYYSSWSSLFVHSFNVFFSISLFHFSIDRKYLFLLCNGIVVFLSTSSGAIGPSKMKTEDNLSETFSEFSETNYVVQNEVEVQRVVQESETCEEENKDVALITNEEEDRSLTTYEEEEEEQEEEEEDDDDDRSLITYEKEEEEEEDKDRSLITYEEEEEDDDDDDDDRSLITYEEEKEEEDDDDDDDRSLITYEKVEGANGMLSTEELNRKCDEFIRKMKEELRTGAQQQLVMV